MLINEPVVIFPRGNLLSPRHIRALFALAYRRSHVLEDQTLFETNPIFLEHLGRHDLNAKRVVGEVMFDFNGWDMPLSYPAGILQEHMGTRKKTGILEKLHGLI